MTVLTKIIRYSESILVGRIRGMVLAESNLQSITFRRRLESIFFPKQCILRIERYDCNSGILLGRSAFDLSFLRIFEIPL